MRAAWLRSSPAHGAMPAALRCAPFVSKRTNGARFASPRISSCISYLRGTSHGATRRVMDHAARRHHCPHAARSEGLGLQRRVQPSCGPGGWMDATATQQPAAAEDASLPELAAADTQAAAAARGPARPPGYFARVRRASRYGVAAMEERSSHPLPALQHVVLRTPRSPPCCRAT
jgi:hypothetical protein